VRIELRISGGVTGVRRPPVVLDTAALDAGQAAALEALAERVELREAASPPPGPDRLQYDLALERPAGRRAGVLHEGAMSSEAAELVARVRALGRSG